MIVDLGANPDVAFDSLCAALRRGEVAVIPTETVYGLVALASNPDAIAQLFALKGRADTKSIAVLVADRAQAGELSDYDFDQVGDLWPGPLTVVVNRKPNARLYLGADDATIGIRCPDHDFVHRVAATLGPVAATSANRAGEPTPPDAQAVAAVFRDVGVVIDGGACNGVPSTVVDCTTKPAHVLRLGAVPAEAVAHL